MLRCTVELPSGFTLEQKFRMIAQTELDVDADSFTLGKTDRIVYTITDTTNEKELDRWMPFVSVTKLKIEELP